MSGTVLGPGGANYLAPNMQPMAYKTYGLVAPVATHFRNGTCQEVECEAYQNGWTSIFDIATELGRKQAYYVRMHSGRSFTISELGTLITFAFPPGQQCFAEHKVKLDRDPRFFTYHGDWRGRFSDPVTRTPSDWLDDFANHQDKLKTAIGRG
jgi:hypothetical protein